jgi:hypothetical protein
MTNAMIPPVPSKLVPVDDNRDEGDEGVDDEDTVDEDVAEVAESTKRLSE